MTLKSLSLLVFVLLLSTFAFAQDDDGYLPPEEMANQPNYFLMDLQDILAPNEEGAIKLYTYANEDGKVVYNPQWVMPSDVYQLYLLPQEKKVKEFPKEIFVFNNVQTLYIGVYHFKELPEEFPMRFRNLEILTIHSTPISNLPIPEEVGEKNWKHLSYVELLNTDISPETAKKIKENLPSRTTAVVQ